jgi:hypothetical protein
MMSNGKQERCTICNPEVKALRVWAELITAAQTWIGSQGEKNARQLKAAEDRRSLQRALLSRVCT